MNNPEDIFFNVNESIVLRSLHISDARASFNLICKNRDSLGKFLPWVNLVKKVEDEVEFIQQSQAAISEGKKFELGIFMKGPIKENDENHDKLFSVFARKTDVSMKMIGTCGFVDIEKTCGWIGYWLDEDFRGQGIITIACKYLLESVAKKLGITEAKMHIQETNLASQRVAKRLGFVSDQKINRVNLFGEMVDALLFVYTIG